MNDYALFGPGGNSDSFYSDGMKHTWQAPKWVKSFGLDAYEYQAGNGLTGSEASFRKVGEMAAEAGIHMTLHAPYYISLSGVEEVKRLNSLGYIEKSQDAAKWLGASLIVIHTGSAAKLDRQEAMNLVRNTLGRALTELPDNGVAWGLETMGKQNQLGTLEEVVELCKISPRLKPVVDFGHINARCNGYFYSEDEYRRIFDYIGANLSDEAARTLHCHFSKIEYTKAGEKKHLTFADTQFGPPFEPLIKAIIDEKLAPTIICESNGTMAEDALAMKNLYRGN